MHHPDEDKILRFALEACSDKAERSEIEQHIAQCESCRAAVERVHQDMTVLGSIRPEGIELARPRSQPQATRTFFAVLRAAALVAFGIFTGLGLSEALRDEPISVSAAYATLSVPLDSTFNFADADATGIRIRTAGTPR